MLSKRQKIAGIEQSTMGIGVSTSVRIYARKYYAGWGMSDMAKMRNADLNNIIAQDFAKSEPKTQFKLRDGSIGEIRKSSHFYYLGRKRPDGNYDVLVIQQGYKQPRNKK